MLKNLFSNTTFQAIGFQVAVHVLVFFFYATDRRNPGYEFSQIVFYANLVIHANIVGYLFIPKYLYQKKYLQFGVAIALTLISAMVMEELVLEKIYYPDTRGLRFLGVFFTLMGIVPVMAVLVGFKFAWDLVRSQKEIDNLKNLVKESELAFLKSQINPHFLFNTMNNLYSYAITKSSKTPQLILDFSSVLRYMLYDCKANKVSLSQEIKHLEEFVKISQMQIENRGEVKFTQQVAQSNLEIAPLILIVFIENAFKHSTSSLSDNISISIDLKVDDHGVLYFLCKNTFALEETATLGGIGMNNVKKRLELLYPKQHSLDLRRITPPDYEVFLQIKLSE